MVQIFTYGTLKKGRYNHYLVERSPYLGIGLTLAEYDLISLGTFPAVVANGVYRIKGEVYDVDDQTLSRLDQLEGNGFFYQRRLVEVDVETAKLTVWMYLLLRGIIGYDDQIKATSQIKEWIG